MSKITKQRKVRRKLRVVRMFAYTAVSFTILQYIGIFALAGIRGMYVKTDSKLNAFYPKTYVNVELEEYDDTNHVYVVDSNGNVYADADDDKNKVAKQLYVQNPGTNKKDVMVRAKIVATIFNKDGTVIGETQDFVVTGSALRSTININEEKGCWYNPKVTEITKEDENGVSKTVSGKYQVTTGTSDDGYFYYTSILVKNSSTENLFDDVKLTNIDNVPDDGYVEFNVIVDTVEVEQNSDGTYDFEKVTTAWGKTDVLEAFASALSKDTNNDAGTDTDGDADTETGTTTDE